MYYYLTRKWMTYTINCAHNWQYIILKLKYSSLFLYFITALLHVYDLELKSSVLKKNKFIISVKNI